MELKTLIEQDASIEGGYAQLAKKIGVEVQNVSDWRLRGKSCPLHHQAKMAAIAGLNPKEWVWEVVSKKMGKAAKHVTTVSVLLFAISTATVCALHAWPHGLKRAR